MRRTMQEAMAQTTLAVPQHRIHIETAEDHVVRRAERQFDETPCRRERRCCTHKDGFRRTAFA